MDANSAIALMSEKNNLTWFATELSKQAPHWSCQPRVTDGLSAPFMLSPASVILYKSLMDVSSAMTLMSEQNNLTWFATELSKQAPHWSCQPRVTDWLSAPFMLSPTSVILYKSLMGVSSVIALTSLSKTT